MWRFLLLFLSCLGVQQYAMTNVNEITILDTFAVGRPMQKAVWKTKPIIKMCDSTGVTIFRTQKAIKYWEMLGYEVGDAYMGYSINCMEPRYGVIIITLPEGNIDDDHMAATKIYTEKITGNIVKAKIFIYPKDATRARVIEHELGHAFGWMHHRQKYHIMHPNWHLGGYDSAGLRK